MVRKTTSQPSERQTMSNPSGESDPVVPQSQHKIKILFVAAGVALIVLLLGVLVLFGKKPLKPPVGSNPGSGTLQQKLAGQSEMKKFSSPEEIQQFLKQNVSDAALETSGGVMPMMGRMFESTKEMSAPSAAPQAAMDAANVGSPVQQTDDYSRTNVQVQGVDEADIIKTDGSYIYAVTGRKVVIVQANPTDSAKVVSAITLKQQPQDIFVEGDRLMVFGDDQDVRSLDIYRTFKRQSAYTQVVIYDISNKAEPKQVKEFKFEGNYFNSRMIGDHVYFLTNTYAPYFEDETPFPRVLSEGKEIDNYDGKTCNRCPDMFYIDMPYSSYTYVTVAAINMKDPGKDLNRQVYLLPSGQNMYVSDKNIFLTYTKYVSEYDLSIEVMREIVMPRLSPADKERITKIEEADAFLLNPGEKKQKIAAVLEHYHRSLSDDEQQKLEEEVEQTLEKKYDDISKELEKTVVHKIAIEGDKLEYIAHGEVTGHVLNQFSMDEHDGYFRIATTRSQQFRPMPFFFGWNSKRGGVAVPERIMPPADRSDDSYSNLFVLDKNMEEVGRVEELAKGEQIYSVRFMQNRAYMVTFKRTDPLFVIDLADPKEPKVLGKLKVPGFSNYLHPYDENTLIGIGKETEENQFGGVTTQGIKLSMFDVSDVNNPREIDKYEMGDQGSDSIALHDHKAFLFSKDKELLVLPVYIMKNISQPQQPLGGKEIMPVPPLPRLSFSGAVVFKVTKDGFELRGKIDHSDGGKFIAQDPWYGGEYYDSTVKRSLYINDTLFTFSDRLLQANRIADLGEISKVDLKKNTSTSNSDADVSCKTDSDCVFKLVEGNACVGRSMCVNKNYDVPDDQITPVDPGTPCPAMAPYSNCQCVNNQCQYGPLPME